MQTNRHDPMHLQVSQLQEERDRLQAELAALQDKMAHRPLLDASSSADPDAHISSRGASNKQESATIEQLQDKVRATRVALCHELGHPLEKHHINAIIAGRTNLLLTCLPLMLHRSSC